jgi:hypothetical protein
MRPGRRLRSFSASFRGVARRERGKRLETLMFFRGAVPEQIRIRVVVSFCACICYIII